MQNVVGYVVGYVLIIKYVNTITTKPQRFFKTVLK